MPDVMFDIIDEGMTVDVIVENPVIDVGLGELIVSIVTVEGPAGPAGAGGGEVQLAAVTAQALSGHRIVTTTNVGLMDYADCSDAVDAVKPLAMTTGAWSSGAAATAELLGVITEPSWNWTPGLPIWLGHNGVATQTLPNDAVIQRQVAEVITPTKILFAAQTPIALA